MVEIVAGEDDDGTIGGKVSLKQCRADVAHSLQRLRVGDGAPSATRIPLSHKHTLGRSVRPVEQPIRQLVRIGREGTARFEVDRAISATVNANLWRAKLYRTRATWWFTAGWLRARHTSDVIPAERSESRDP